MGSTVDFKIIILSVFLILLAIKLFLSQVSKQASGGLSEDRIFQATTNTFKEPTPLTEACN